MDSDIICKASCLASLSTQVRSLLKGHAEFRPLQLKKAADLSERISVTATTLITVLKNITYKKNLASMGLILPRRKKKKRKKKG